jgi:hypothetical protein
VSWAVATGNDNGEIVIVTIDDDFRDVSMRAGLSTRISMRFLGNYMMQSIENRTRFESSIQPFLDEHGGSIVAGITRRGQYTFHAYCRPGDVHPDRVPIGDEWKSMCTVSVHDDPEWAEYQRWLPAKVSGIRKAVNVVLALALLALGKLRRRQ